VRVEIVFESHATSTHNEAGIASGWLDGRLSESGRREAVELGERRQADGIAAVYTSDLGRAVETAELAFAGSGIPLRRDARLRECDYGSLAGGSARRVGEVKSEHLEEPFPHGESYRQVAERVGAFVEELRQRHAGERVVVIGHSATRWALAHLLTGEPLEDLVNEHFVWQDGWEYVLRDPELRTQPPDRDL
jgi:2,3-bisphosphoglycerate-dependent phosphoglycerate mutase